MKYKVGDKAEAKRTFSEEEVKLFADLSHDINPVHLDETYAATTLFKARIVHGAFVTSFISAVIGNTLPGNGSIYLNQTTNFKRPVYFNDEMTCIVEVIEAIEEKSLYKLSTNCYNSKNELVVEGSAAIKLYEGK